jgi:hypothetical protein
MGVAEAAPPPFLHDRGIAEAAPPPYERPVSPAVAEAQVKLAPAIAASLGGQPAQSPFTFRSGGTPLVLGDPSSPIHATIRLIAHPLSRVPRVHVASARPLTVECAGKSAAAPWTAEFAPDRRLAFTLVDPASGAKVTVRLFSVP